MMINQTEPRIRVEMTVKQARTVIAALELNQRVAMGHLSAVGDAIHAACVDGFDSEKKEWIDAHMKAIHQGVLGFLQGSHRGIADPKTGDAAKIAYDLMKGLQQVVAEIEDHHEWSVWRDGPSLHLGSEPLAEVERVDPE